jgi:2-(1,2-epoxy-1,2-dihydrophenyl)acetyl-CoA isomerase
MACDLAVMDEGANIYLAFAAIGLIPDGGATWHLLRAMGYKRALQTIIEGRKIQAQECEALGLVNKLAPAGAAHEIALQWAQQLAKGAPLAQSAAKRVLRHGGRMRLQDAITLEAKVQQPLVESQDFKEGVAAFFGKRKPEFKGR